jgi:hypothetical protein
MKTETAPPKDKKTKQSHFDLLTSILVLMASLGLALFFLWAASRFAGVDTFEHLPDWLKNGYGTLFTTLISGGSLLTVLIKNIRSGLGANYLIWIVVLAALFCIFIVGLSKAVKQPNKPSPTPDRAPTPAVVTEKKSWHATNDKNQFNSVDWGYAGNCEKFVRDPDHLCEFKPIGRKIGDDKTYYDHFLLRFRPPEHTPTEVSCTLGSHQLNEDDLPGIHLGKVEGEWAVCSGWINGGMDTVKMTVKYQTFW